MSNELTIDERLKFLLTSTESLHASCQELHAAAAESRRQFDEQSKRLEEQNKQYEQQRRDLHKLNAAMLAAIRAYLEGLNGKGE